MYAALPTKNYYWDGISFSLAIEGFRDTGPAIIHQNHLLYTPLGLAVRTALAAAGVHVRALYLLQGINMILGALCAWILMRTIQRSTGSLYLALCLGALFAFSAHWWKFATDADAYIPAVLLLLLTFHELAGPDPRPPRVVALFTGAMLMHQLSAIFFPVAALGIARKRGWRTAVFATAAAGALALGAYYAGFRLDDSVQHPETFPAWITSHSNEVSFGFHPVRTATVTAVSYLRLFFGGRARLFVQFFGVFEALCVAALLAALAALVVQLVRGRHNWAFKRVPASWELKLAAVWVAVYAVFLLFWLPRNTFYKLFLLPPLVYAAGCYLARYSGPRRFRLALFTAAVAFPNLAFSVYPNAQTEASVPLSYALRIGRQWSANTVVCYKAYVADNWYIRYFNPRTTWKRLDGDFRLPAREAAQGRDVWLDTTAADLIPSRGPAVDAGEPKHRIRFVKFQPG